MNLYLSEFSVRSNIERSATYAEATHAVISFCGKNSVHCWRSNEFTDYTEIEKRIKGSDIFVALVDQYWNSSTWKGHEFVYSSGGPSMVDGIKGKQLTKRIAFLVDGIEFPSCLHRALEPIVVVSNISALNDALAQALPA
ncbi:hypothetical protein [Methylomonas koyamae]|uniref:hypothetical protein n=1 Tax=Methylomonas koyamae TaxID=702114 RepID=UPI000BDE8604|nr:hypothetical protein [Methylomonas koyamae]